MAAIICIDFDRTVVEGDIAAGLIERFARPGWRELRAQRRSGELTLEQYSAAAFATLEATRQEIVEHALEIARPRPGLAELVDWAEWNGWQTAVVSTGWDIYIEAILESLGLERTAVHCGRTRFTYHWRLRYLSPRGIELADGFKTAYAAAYRDLGDTLVWVGDGPNDVAPARISTAVFARETLWEELNGAHDRVYAFETFHDVVAVLEREGAGWLKFSSSTTAAEA